MPADMHLPARQEDTTTGPCQEKLTAGNQCRLWAINMDVGSIPASVLDKLTYLAVVC